MVEKIWSVIPCACGVLVTFWEDETGHWCRVQHGANPEHTLIVTVSGDTVNTDVPQPEGEVTIGVEISNGYDTPTTRRVYGQWIESIHERLVNGQCRIYSDN